jgi:hypothetical protein
LNLTATKILSSTPNKACLALGKKPPSHFSVLSSPFSQQVEDRASIRMKLYDILDPSPMESLPMLYHTEKKAEPFLPTSQSQSCLCETAEWTDKHHTPCENPLLTTWENNPAQPLGRLKPPSKTEKHKQPTVI